MSHLPRFFVNQAIAGQYHRSAELVRLAVEIGDFSSRFFDQQYAGGDIPFVETEFPENIEASGGHTGEIESRGPVASNAVRAQRKIPVVMNVWTGDALMRGKSSAQQACCEFVDFGDLKRFAVECGALGASGAKQFVVIRIVDDAGDQRVALRQAHRDAEAWIAVSKIGGAVERIDVPAKFRAGVVSGAFFCDDAVIGEVFPEAL